MTESEWFINAGHAVMPKYEMEDIIVDEIDVTQQNYLKSGKYVKIGKQQLGWKPQIKGKGL